MHRRDPISVRLSHKERALLVAAARKVCLERLADVDQVDELEPACACASAFLREAAVARARKVLGREGVARVVRAARVAWEKRKRKGGRK